MLNFVKYQGAGNDFILIEDYRRLFPVRKPQAIVYLCHRQYGIGADGLILVQSSRIADVKMRIFNADGTEATMCGNGLRCLVRHLEGKNLSIETKAGISLGGICGDQVRATFPRSEIVFSPLALPSDLTGHLVETGTDHLVVIIDSFEGIDFPSLARKLRRSEMFAPGGVNVNFVVLAPNKESSILIRTYEKGVEGETLACGTGGAAAALVLRNFYHKQKEIVLAWPSGDKIVYTFDSKGRIWMDGPAERVFEGNFVLQKYFHTYGLDSKKRVKDKV